jgi:hypothetical protein
MDVAEEILQQFARQQGPGSLVKGGVPDTYRSQGYAFLVKHPDKGRRGRLEAIHAKVIGKRSCVALQKEFKIRNEIAVLFE